MKFELKIFRILICIALALQLRYCLSQDEAQQSEERENKAKIAEPYFSYKLCEPNEYSNTTVRVDTVDLRPDPIRLNAEIRFSLDISLATELPLDAEIALTIYRAIKFFGGKINMRIPCISNFGSCIYNLCSVADMVKDQICKYFPADQSCLCPFEQGRYFLQNVTINLPHLSDGLVDLAVGDYSGEVKLSSGEQELACAKYNARLIRE